MKQLPPDLGVILLAECVARGLSVPQLARESGLALSVTQNLLNGRTRAPRLDTLLAVLGALGRDLAWLHDRGITPESARAARPVAARNNSRNSPSRG